MTVTIDPLYYWVLYIDEEQIDLEEDRFELIKHEGKY